MRSLVVALIGALLVAGCGGDDASDTTTTTAAIQPPSAPKAEPSQQRRRGFRLAKIGDFEAPLFVTAPPGDRKRVMVAEQAGRVIVVRGGHRSTFLDVRSLVTSGGEQGFLSIAFAPDYATSRRFYVYYTDRDANQRVVEYRAAGDDRADPGSARLVLEMDDAEPNHNGGLLLFGPDKHLYIGTGDGGGGGDRHGPRGNAQNLGSLLGKILRIDPAASGGRPYTVPSDNPFAGRSGARPEIYAYGLRNPWRFSFDRRTGDLAIADVGQDAVEEVDFVRRGKGAGANFGWRPFEGSRRYTSGESAPGHVKPVFERLQTTGWCSVTGGVIVRDPKLPGLAGRYVFGDFCEGRVWVARLKRPRAEGVRRTSLRVASLSSFGEDAAGRVYATSLDGPVYRFVAK